MVDFILLEAAQPAVGGNNLTLIMMVAVMGIMIFFTTRSNKKKEREAQAVRDSMEVGDEIVTIGGIVARVVKLEEDTILVESGSDRSKLRMKRESVGENVTSMERVAAAKEKAKAEAASNKAGKKK